ncbi:MAG TPA: DedA family protein [Tepidisphaeraceae bacterium]|nr:DedA family protein [Tepidisphaeraceae bacterium]
MPDIAFLHHIHDFVRLLIQQGGYIAVFSLLVACGLGLPLPEDIPLFSAGILIAKGAMNPWAAALTGWFGIMAGDTALYCVAATLGPKIVGFPIIGRHITHKRLDAMHRWFERYGTWAVGLGRMMTGIRGAMVVVAGLIGFNYVKFIIVDSVAAIFSGGIFMVLGYYVTKHHLVAKGIADFASYGMTGVFFVLTLFVVLFFWWRNRRLRQLNDDESEG